MSNSNHSAKFINMLIALMASIAIALTCIVPTALAEDGDGTDDNNGGSTVQPAGPVPNIIITNFTYGDGSVAVGTNFDLGFTFQNMGKVAVSNMVVTVDGGENFAISGGTNTFYYDSLWAGYSLTQTVPMQVLSSAKNGAQGIDINFKYEYVDGGTRNSNTSDIKISVPVSQPDRFELGDPVLPDAINAGEESTISMEYVNKGKGDVSNVEASIEGDGITATQATQYIGNVASGASGSIGFAFTADAAGEYDAKLKVTYEDADGQQQTKESTISMEYVNKGKGDVSNVEASIEGDGITATQATQYIGNVASGASGSIGFAFTADAAGEYDAKLKVTYEDADGQQQTKESPVKITVSEAPAPADPGMDVDPQENQGIPTWVWIVVAVAVVAVIAIVVVVVVRRRKKAKKAAEDDDWDWDPSDSHAGADDGAANTAGAIDAPTQVIDSVPSDKE